MAVDVVRDAAGTPTWWVTCADCGACGPTASSASMARARAKHEGFSRCYRGYGEQFRCPGCRAGGKLSGAPASLIARALLYAAGGDAGGTDTESFDDDEREQMVTTARDLMDRAAAYSTAHFGSQIVGAS